VAAEKAALFTALRPLLTAEAARPGHEALAAGLGMSTAAVGTAVFRMRRRYGELMRYEIAQTVTSPAEVEEEIAHLIRVVARG
jgi:RNA polymerase sigma-70 factor (ECF subfamily)